MANADIAQHGQSRTWIYTSLKAVDWSFELMTELMPRLAKSISMM